MFLERLLGSARHASYFDAAPPADPIRSRRSGGHSFSGFSFGGFPGLFFLWLGLLSFYLERLRKRGGGA